MSLGVGRPSGGRGHKGNHPRQSSSSVFQNFEPGQIQAFKEAFNMVDQDGDGLISENDMSKMLQQLGLNSSPSTVSSYFDSAGNSRQINFTTFLTMFSDRLLSLDPEDEMLEAFASFDEKDSGYVSVAKMKELLSSMGDRMSDDEIQRFLSPPFADKHGMFNYREFLKYVRVHSLEDQQKIAASGGH